MDRRTTAFFALFIALILTLSGFSGIFLFPASYYPGNSYAGVSSSGSGPLLNGSSVEIPISLPTHISQLGIEGKVYPTTPISLKVVISSRNPVGLEQYVNEVSSPLSPEYRQFLSPQKFAELYGPDSDEINSLSSYFASKGLHATEDLSDPSILQVSGDALQVESALQISLDSFRVSNQSFYSPLYLPELPGRFSFVQTIYGLSNYTTPQSTLASPMYREFGMISGKPDQTAANNIYYTPSEMYQIYNSSSLLATGYNGSGVTIAIVDAYGDPYIQDELNNFSLQFNLPQVAINQICVDGPCNYANGLIQGWQPEIALDVEWAHAMAPDAAINLYIAVNASFPMYDAVEEAVSNSSNSIISMSWGSPENSIAASSPLAPIEGQSYPWADQVFQQAAAEGITAFSSTGDYGAYDQGYMGESLPYGGPNYPATDPYVTAVGGTSLYMNTTSGTIQFPYSNATGGYGSETAWSWSDQYGWGTGGGYSSLFATPPWQRGPGFNPSTGMRGVPDVAWDADPSTGVAVALYDPAIGGVSYFVIGGTSVGSPSWAGSLATMEQKGGHKLGLITPELYSILSNPREYSKAFHDVTIGNNNPLSAGPGWNPLTGMGSPNLGELANLLAPSGSLEVSVTNSLSGQPSYSFAYGSQVQFTANISSPSGVVTTGSVVGNISGPANQVIASGIQFSYNSGVGEWTGSYAIKSSDPPGEWIATVVASDGAVSGWGTTTFSVGDGIDLFLPVFNTSAPLVPIITKFTVGQTVNITAEITSPSGSCCVTSGKFTAFFNENSPTGKSEGSTPLFYNSTSALWMAHYKIPQTVDQDSWALTVSGTDSSGNSGSTYTWMYVGMNIVLTTDSPTYVLGDTITIKAMPEYTGGLEASTGSFTATVSHDSQPIASLPLALNPTEDAWMAQLPLTSTSPTGFYLITVTGDDGHGSAGTSGTVVRVAPYSLKGTITIPSPTISINGGSEPMVSAAITYPNGSLMTQGSVDAFVYIDHEGLEYPISLIRLTYNPSSGSFVGPYLLGPSSPLNTTLGSYLVSVQGYDAAGDYANLTSTFFVKGEGHSPIAITENSQFTFDNGVVLGNGTSLDPFVLAGWNTTSISISGGATAIYEIANDWISGSTGDGIYLNTTAAVGSLIYNTFSVSNGGNGIDVEDVPGITLISDVASYNALNGVMIENDTGSLPPYVALTVSNGNGLDGFTLANEKSAIVSINDASSDGKFGYYFDNLANASVTFDNATEDPVGFCITGAPGQSYGLINFVLSLMVGDGIGLEVNGLDQNLTGRTISNTSQVYVELSTITNDTVGVEAGNNSVVELYANTIGFNYYGVVYNNSVPIVISNVIAQNNETGVQVSGSVTGKSGCIVAFVNSTVKLFSSCISGNYISLNGNSSSSGDGIAETNLNGSLILANYDSHNTADGLVLNNVTHSVFSLNSFNDNSGAGVYASNTTKSQFDSNNMTGDGTGIFLNYGNTDQVSRSNATQDSLDGIALNFSTNNTITENNVSSIGSACGSEASCTFAGGINLENDSSLNMITFNSISNVTSTGNKIGGGIVLIGNSTQNLIYRNNATTSDAGIVISDSVSNTVSENSLALNNYGVYLLGPGSSTAGLVNNNKLSGDRQDVYPSAPTVAFSGITNGTSVSGIVQLKWFLIGQGISNQTLKIDGLSENVTGSSYAWNSTSLPDGLHFVTLTVTNEAGQNASASLIVTTVNHEFLTVEALGPENTPISNSPITLSNSTYSTNATTDASGIALFGGLSSGSYNASTSINGTGITSPVSYAGNSSLILFVPTLTTTAEASTISGKSVPIEVSGNLTSSQLSNVMLQNVTGGGFLLTFDLSGARDSGALVTLAIPKNYTATNLIPVLLINGKRTNSTTQQDTNYYYVRFFPSFANGTMTVSIQLSPAPSAFNLRYAIVIVVVIAIIAAGVILALRRGSKKNYYLPSQSN